MADPSSLQNLHDIVMPPTVSWWPPAPGWYAVASGILIGIVWFIWQRYWQWRADAYRRAALNELSRLKSLIDSEEREPALRKLPELVKRTAMSAWPREKLAALTGNGWLQFLDRFGNTDAFTKGDGQLLTELPYAGHQKLNGISDDQVFSLVKIVEKWILEHRAG